MIRVTVWNENRHEQLSEQIRAVYPQGIHGAVASAFPGEHYLVRTATLDQPDQGLPQALLDDTDVLIYWAHIAHQEVLEETVQRIHARVLAGMGIIVLHSGHASKIFQRLMGTDTQSLRWREDDELCRVWTMDASHPIAAGMGDYFDIPHEETYGERFAIPAPEELVFVSWFPGGEVFRSGCCWKRGLGKVFYFQPGHETNPVYYQQAVQQVLRNAAAWAAPTVTYAPFTGHCQKIQG